MKKVLLATAAILLSSLLPASAQDGQVKIGVLNDQSSSFSALGGSEVVEAVKLAIADFGGQEVTAEPPRPLTMEGMPDGESAPAGTIGYYAPDGVVVLYYTDVGRYNGIVRLGRIDGDISILKGWDEVEPMAAKAPARRLEGASRTFEAKAKRPAK
ncbi:MAG: hypothetical protein LCH62_00555 [Proteobacteria bacterium]|nr:hypothetical protein [Pseudomonadota bacterium]